MKIRIETSSLATRSISGVGYYTKGLTEALGNTAGIDLAPYYFNFLNRQPHPQISIQNKPYGNIFFPLRVYAKLQSYNVALPFDIFLSPADLTIFPNFATWPTVHSKLKATVIHDLTYIYFPEYTEEKNLDHLRRVVPRTINDADFIITVSEAVKSEIVKEFSIDPARCVVTPIPPDPLFYEKNNNEIHKKYKIPTQRYIYFLGTLEPRKNIPTLIAAYRQLPEAIKKTHSLVLAGGKGWKAEKAQQAIEAARLEGENVIHIGYIDQRDSSALFQKADAFVIASEYEGFGMPLVEAMAGKTPVVAANIPVFREVGEDSILYADPHDPAAFRDGILKVLSSPNLVKQLQKRMTIQLKKISWANNAQKITNCAESLLQPKNETKK